MSRVEEILKKMKKPQEETMGKIADYADVERGATSEETAFNIVDKTSERLGVPEDSKLANAAKAAAVAGLDYFIDPNPLGKIIKPLTRGFKTAKKIIDKMPSKESAAKVYKTAKDSGRGVAVVKTAQELDEAKTAEKLSKGAEEYLRNLAKKRASKNIVKLKESK